MSHFLYVFVVGFVTIAIGLFLSLKMYGHYIENEYMAGAGIGDDTQAITGSFGAGGSVSQFIRHSSAAAGEFICV